MRPPPAPTRKPAGIKTDLHTIGNVPQTGKETTAFSFLSHLGHITDRMCSVFIPIAFPEGVQAETFFGHKERFHYNVPVFHHTSVAK